ncbi:Putative amidoligase enzyme [Fodinibius roseus]|uniref:Putative amidoligase enzyme n=1 Tax=Fodinibius roseus TaxID=1194090 RepID=A0A1M5K469_9BACT|nr:amidoligase family protein [Fodinibius roseus]SHG47269.1 Putative amidoligase enzyme [Fodinibius roseus]
MSYKLPEIINTARGDQRKVGLELELAGIEIEKVAEIVQSLYGGDINEEHRYHYEISDSKLGDFRIELDARILRKMANRDIFGKWGTDLEEESIRKSLEDAVDKLAKTVVPLEVVMPPIPVTELYRLEDLRERLQENKAEGTHTSFVHAFGMHINIESPDLKTETLLNYLRSFLILYPWLLEVLEVDFSRRISPFVDPFSQKYVVKILEPSYNPDQEQFIRDYLEFNPTRNRPLDMMPIFARVNNKLIYPVMKGRKNDPRPTFHYRLPNSRIDDPEWRFEDEWNRWLEIEKLAGDKEMLHKLSRLYLTRNEETVMSFRREWATTVTILLDLDE